MEQIAKKLTQYFLAHGLIKEDDAEVCQYALYRRISRAVGLIALTLLGGLITDFGSAFCFTVSFLFLRERTGGYHAKTEWQCALYSAAMIFATMFALPIFAEEPNNYWAIMIASSALIWVSSPADNKQIHLSRAESKAMAKRARLRLLLLGAVSLALLGVHGHLFASSIALAELSVAVSLMMASRLWHTINKSLRFRRNPLMKETMQQHLHTVGQKAIQNVIRHEYGDWPPKSGGFYYQPHRPEKKPAAAQPQTPSK